MAPGKSSKSNPAPAGEVVDIAQLPIQQLNQLTQSLDKVTSKHIFTSFVIDSTFTMENKCDFFMFFYNMLFMILENNILVYYGVALSIHLLFCKE